MHIADSKGPRPHLHSLASLLASLSCCAEIFEKRRHEHRPDTTRDLGHPKQRYQAEFQMRRHRYCIRSDRFKIMTPSADVQQCILA